MHNEANESAKSEEDHRIDSENDVNRPARGIAVGIGLSLIIWIGIYVAYNAI